MHIRANAEAIKVYNSAPPEQWANLISEDHRRKWFLEKRTQEIPALADLNRPVKIWPKAPDFLKSSFERDLEESILDFFSGDSTKVRVQTILRDRVVGGRFGTDWISGRWRIVHPPLKGTYGDLRGFAHELGHVLADQGHLGRSLNEMIVSETAALILEKSIVAAYLTGVNRELWENYQDDLDKQNEFFHHLEAVGTWEESKFKSYIFRETLWTAHGYQLVYAAASRHRRHLEREPAEFSALVPALIFECLV